MIAPEIPSTAVSHNLEVLSYYNKAPTLRAPFQIRLIIDKHIPTQIIPRRISADELAIHKPFSNETGEEKYGIQGVARILSQIIPRLNEIRDIHLLQSALEGVTKLTSALKGIDRKILLKPLSDALVAHINSQPKHRIAAPIKSALKIDVTDLALKKQTKAISFGPDIIFQVTPHKNPQKLPSIVPITSPIKDVFGTRDLREPEKSELPEISSIETRCAKILEKGEGVPPLSDKMRLIIEDLTAARTSYIYRNRASIATLEYTQITKSYRLRISQLACEVLNAYLISKESRPIAPLSNSMYW